MSNNREMDASMSIANVRKECPICGKMGSVQAVEIIPGGGILYRSIHDKDSTQCQYSDYPNVDAMRNAKTDQPQQEIRCPECNELGIIIAEKDESDRAKPGTWKYLVSHPTGNQRCLIRPENRDTILKTLNRYIKTEVSPVNDTSVTVGKTIASQLEIRAKPRPKAKRRKSLLTIICPRCNKPGAAFTRHNKGSPLTIIHQARHGFTKVESHQMRSEIEKTQFSALLDKTLEDEKKQRLTEKQQLKGTNKKITPYQKLNIALRQMKEENNWLWEMIRNIQVQQFRASESIQADISRIMGNRNRMR